MYVNMFLSDLNRAGEMTHAGKDLSQLVTEIPWPDRSVFITQSFSYKPAPCNVSKILQTQILQTVSVEFGDR